MKAATIVVGYDGSDFAHKALEASCELVNDGGTVHVVTAYDTPSARDISALYRDVPPEYTVNIDLLAAPRGHLADAKKFLESRGINREGHFVDDHPASAILDTAENVSADMIVVGSRGLGRASRFLRGSVSAKVAAHAHTSFLVVQD